MIFLQFLRGKFFVLILGLIVVFSAQVIANTETFQGEVNKGSIDDRQYQYLVLDNKLRVILISDSNADKAAASLDVNVGSYHDPVEREGLAHFLEHMLFLGTKKFPSPDEYQAFISDNGGSHNAFTGSHHTNYFFDIDVKKLDLALDRFAQFFIAPLFDAAHVERERNAVHSEYQANLRNDFRRSHDVYRTIINPKNPEAKFSVGSLTTLADREGDKVRGDILAFYKRYYSADQMSLVVLGKEPLRELEKMVVERFSQVPVSLQDSEKPAKAAPLFLDGQLPMEVLSKPVKELRQMSMNFSLPSVAEYYQEKPLDYIAYFLGHEGKGSLLSLLKSEGLAEGLSARGSDKNNATAAFYITIQLTKKGVQQREKIRALVFYTLEQIKKHGIEEWRYAEKQLLAKTAFQFREKSSAISTVRSLASNLHDYPVSEVISGDYLLNNYDAQLIERFLSLMTPDNLLVTSVFPDVKTDKITQYYQVPYSSQKISTELPKLNKELLASFSLPQANRFIPKNIALYEVDPSLQEFSRLQAGRINLWAKQDSSYKTPKVKVFFRVLSPVVAGNIKGVVLSGLYADLIRDSLNEYTYPALLADTGMSIRDSNRGFDITLQGYHDKLHELMTLLLQEIDRGDFSQERFLQIKSDQLRSLRNSNKATPYHQLYSRLVVNLTNTYFSDTKKIEVLEKISLKDLKIFAAQWRINTRVQGLYYGNFNQVWLARWQAYAQRLQIKPEGLSKKGTQKNHEKIVAPVSIMRIDNSIAQYDVKPVEHNDQAVILYVQSPSDTVRDKAKMSVLRQIMQSPFYSSLRTQQQLGYIVFMADLRLKEVPGSVFVVQSPSANVDTIQAAIQAFIVNFDNKLPKDIAVYKQAVITQLLEAAPSLSASANILWNDIIQSDGRVDRRQQLIEAIEKLSADDVHRYYQQVMLSSKYALWQFSQEPNNKIEQSLYKKGEQFYWYH